MTNVQIGDSVARPIKPDLVFPGGQSQNLSASGLAIDDVNHWLANIPRNRKVGRVVIRIGVNTCKFAVITVSMWRQLIRKLKYVFPGAAVLVSSIVHPMGRLRTAQVSNSALRAVCSREKVSVVDHTGAFTARSGAPRKDLYRDQVHPSDSGTSRLVFNLQLGTGTRHRPAQQEHQPGSRPHQKQGPPQLQPRKRRIQHLHPAMLLLRLAPSGFVPNSQRHWPAQWISSRQWQRASAPQQRVADLYQSARTDGLIAPLDRYRPPPPPVYQPTAFHDHHSVPRGLYSRETLV